MPRSLRRICRASSWLSSCETPVLGRTAISTSLSGDEKRLTKVEKGIAA